MKIQACKVKNLFDSNDYREGKMASHVIAVGKINYIPLDFVKRTGFLYDLEDIEEIEYTPAFKSELEPIRDIKRPTLAVSYTNIFGDSDIVTEWDKYAIEKDGIRYLSLETLRKTSLAIVGCDIEEISVCE